MTTGSYFDKALSHTNGELVETMRHALKGVKYDTIIGTGLSGTIFTARVAPALRKRFAIVRKEDDKSTHSSRRIEGHVGKKIVFADDFVSTGATMIRALKKFKKIYPEAEIVGVYQYESGKFVPAENCASEFGQWAEDLLFGGPMFGPLTRNEFVRKFPYDRITLTFPARGWHPRVAHLVPLPPMNVLELDYTDSEGRPTFWDPLNGTIKATDPRVSDMVREILDLSRNAPLGRYIGMKMDQVMAMLKYEARRRDPKPILGQAIYSGDLGYMSPTIKF